MAGSKASDPGPSDGAGLETTTVLLARVRDGDAAACNQLLRRYLPIMTRWAHGRLPRGVRDLSETGDLVQETLFRALTHMEAKDFGREGAFLAYLRRIFFHQVCDEFRRHGRRPGKAVLETGHPAEGASPLDEVLEHEKQAIYEAALERLRANHREAVILRIEFGYTYEAVAKAIGCPTPEAARKLLQRALVSFATAMNEVRT